MMSEEIAFTSLSELARGIAHKRLSPIEVTEIVLARINSHDGILNSYITVMAESARTAAKHAEEAVRADRPLGLLHGVPVAVKDLFATKDIRTTFACAAFADWVPNYDAFVVERLVGAGAIIIGKQNLHEAASGSSSLVSHP
jgi:aspartyl-tRNA(Asn)/glutamyl-tRNA(Gln) amidotransferase subunit A